MTACRASTSYFNLPAVRSAMHAEPLQTAGMWLDCTNRVSYTKDIISTIPAHQYLLAQGTVQAAVGQAEAHWKLDCFHLCFSCPNARSQAVSDMLHDFNLYVLSDLRCRVCWNCRTFPGACACDEQHSCLCSSANDAETQCRNLCIRHQSSMFQLA